MLPIQNMTSSEALAKLEPYDDENRNSTVHMFYDSSDGNKLKGVFFDDNEIDDKIVRDFSSGDSPSVFKNSVTIVLNQVEVNGLDVLPKLISRNTLGLSVNEGAIFDVSNVVWKITRDGASFLISGVGGKINIVNGLLEPISEIDDVFIDTAIDLKKNIGISGNQTVDINPANAGLTITSTNNISGGGMNSDITITLFYKKVTF